MGVGERKGQRSDTREMASTINSQMKQEQIVGVFSTRWPLARKSSSANGRGKGCDLHGDSANSGEGEKAKGNIADASGLMHRVFQRNCGKVICRFNEVYATEDILREQR